MSNVTYSAGNLTITVAGLDTVEQALGDLKRKTPAAAKVAINATARQARKLMVAKAKTRYAVNAAGRRHLKDLVQRKKASNSSLMAELHIAKMRNDLGYFKTSPAVPTHFTGMDFKDGPSVWKAKVLKSSGMKTLPGAGGMSKGFLVKFSSGHVGMVQRRIGSKSSHTRTAKGYKRWTNAKVGEVVYSGSALAAALTAYTDAVNADTPNVSPSNKTLAISAACLADGTEVVLDQEQANTVNGFGVATFLNMSGFRLWGNNTAAYPGTTDPKDRWFSVRRFLSWAANSFILTYFSKVDSPANKRLIEAIVDSENVRGNGFVARGVCARYEVIYDEAENTTADLLDGKITFHQYITPYTPAEDIEDVIEFDPDALTTALS